MGSVVQILHAQPVLSRQQIQKAIDSVDYLRDSDLTDAVEQVKFTPVPLSVEELHNLWSGFFQAPYALSAAYQGSVIFIEGNEPIRKPLPVRSRNLYAAAFRQPVIELVTSEAGASQPIAAGSVLAIWGKNLLGDVTVVTIEGEEISSSDILELHNNMIKFKLPINPRRAGLLPLQVIRKRMMGSPPTPHHEAESNLAAFVLRPTISIDDAATLAHINPAVGKDQRLLIHLNRIPSGSIPSQDRSFLMPPRKAAISEIPLPIDGLAKGDYLVRVEVDGAESILLADDSGEYTGPKVSIS
jgi:hypothetical protein